ncbi:MAG: PadR family transcriptional regulator [Solirubrobacterales bacterium]
MLSNTAYVILGFLNRSPASGYDIKQKIDISTRFFFASSYGQIYPELKRLEENGLIAGKAKSQGQRARTEYTITPEGVEQLNEWLASPGDGVEMRDEGILKLFFSIHVEREEQLARLKAIRTERLGSLAQLQEVERTTAGNIPEMPGLVLGYGLELHEFIVGWCDRAIQQLEKE